MRDTGKDEHSDPLLQYIVRNPEAFARNLARIIEEGGKAAAAYMEPRERGEKREAFADDIAEITRTLARVGEYWMRDPQRSLEAQTRLWTGYMGLWGEMVSAMSGRMARQMAEDPAPAAGTQPPPEPKSTRPEKPDKRFADPEWETNQLFHFLKEAYLLTTRWAEDMVRDASDLDEHTRHKADFYVRQIAAALSPSNFVLTNPELLRETLASDGENLARGMKMLAEDIRAGHGDLKIRQSDSTKFRLGGNIATTPGKVVFQNDVCQILQYEATTETVLKRPLLIVPPWINKFYVLDLAPEKSFIRWAVDQGHTVFVVSWINPDARHKAKSFDHYMKEGILKGVDVACKATRAGEVNAVGYCVGGTLLAVTLAWMAAKNDRRVATATFLTTQVDFRHAGDLKVFVDEEQIAVLEKRMAEQGYLDGTKMAAAFNLLRANDLIWPYFVNNYMRGKEPFPFDLLYWNSDSTRMPAANHSFYLRQCYLENRLSRGEMEIDGVKLDLGRIDIPVYNLATREDHIAPAISVFEGSASFGGPVRYVMAGSGHIAGVVNPPEKNKYQHWVGGPPTGDFDAWTEKAEERPGSWWPDWQAWIEARDPGHVKARRIGGGRYKPIEDAPGSYVKVRA